MTCRDGERVRKRWNFFFVFVRGYGRGNGRASAGTEQKKTSKEYVHTDSVGLTVRYTY